MKQHRTPFATILISVDIAQPQEESMLVTGIHDVLRSRHVPALWSFEFQRRAPVLDRIRSQNYEFGLLATGCWVGAQSSRSIFAREVTARLSVARGMEIRPLAIALEDCDIPAHFDLLVKHQIALIRTRSDHPTGSTSALQPRLSRYGIWQSEPTLVIPVASRWTLPWTARRLLQQAIDQGQTLHVAIDSRRLARNISAGLSSLDYLLKLAAARRDNGLLQFALASQLLEMYAPYRERFSSRSILRAA